jgi:hypothetical protein
MKNCYDIIPINEYTYTLKIHGDYTIPIYQTIIKMLKSVNYNNEKHLLTFSAEHVIPFKQYITTQKMPYKTCIKMIDDLTKQIIHLKTLNYGFYGLDINDLLIIDDTFIFCNTQNLLPITTNAFIFLYPVNKPYFSNPELLELTNLPAKINCKCTYYSLGLLVVFCLLNKYLLVGNEIKEELEIGKTLSCLYNTKIYWFLKRCLKTQVEDREILLI